MFGNLLIRFAARHVGRHLHHIPTKHRVAAAAALALLGVGLWWMTKNENWLKLFEFCSAPFVDKVIFSAVEGE